MKLIDADKCPCVSCEDTRNAHCTYEHRSCKKFCDWLNTSAYDIDKVVEELEEIQTEAFSYAFKYNDDFYNGQANGLDKAIEIVKRGGKE